METRFLPRRLWRKSQAKVITGRREKGFFFQGRPCSQSAGDDAMLGTSLEMGNKRVMFNVVLLPSSLRAVLHGPRELGLISCVVSEVRAKVDGRPKRREREGEGEGEEGRKWDSDRCLPAMKPIRSV